MASRVVEKACESSVMLFPEINSVTSSNRDGTARHFGSMKPEVGPPGQMDGSIWARSTLMRPRRIAMEYADSRSILQCT